MARLRSIPLLLTGRRSISRRMCPSRKRLRFPLRRSPPPWPSRRGTSCTLRFKERTAGGVKVPLLIYGVTSAVGAFPAQLARLSGLGPIIGIAGGAGDFAQTLVDHVVDYRQKEDALVAAIESILANQGLGEKVPCIFDAISEGGSLEASLRFIDPDGGVISTVLPPKLFAKDKENLEYPAGVKTINTGVPRIHSTGKDFGYLWSRYLGRLLGDARLKAHPYEVIPDGLHGVLQGLQNLRDGKASAVKYVYRIEEIGALGIVGSPQEAPQQAAAGSEGAHALSVFPFPE